MRSAGIVEAEIPADRGARLSDRVVSSEVDLLVLDRSPEPLAETVVAPGPFAIHADGDAVPGQHPGEGLAGELGGFKRSSQHGLFRLIVGTGPGSEEHTSELQSHDNLVCRLLLEK